MTKSVKIRKILSKIPSTSYEIKVILGISKNKVNQGLRCLLAGGFIQVKKIPSPYSKPVNLYSLTTKGILKVKSDAIMQRRQNRFNWLLIKRQKDSQNAPSNV